MKSIFITGASSGLGRALALHYAKKNITLGLVARRKEKLESLSKECIELGATVFIYTADVAIAKDMESAINRFLSKIEKIDLVFANAGIGAGGKLDERGIPHSVYSTESMDRLFAVNVTGVYNTINPFIPKMLDQKSGHCIVISSIAAFRPLPRGMYSASKIAVRYIFDVYRQEFMDFGLSFSTIHMGFVKSELTDKNDFGMPFIMDTNKAAIKISKATKSKKKNYTFPWQWRFIVPILKRLPDRMLINSARKNVKKK